MNRVSDLEGSRLRGLEPELVRSGRKERRSGRST